MPVLLLGENATPMPLAVRDWAIELALDHWHLGEAAAPLALALALEILAHNGENTVALPLGDLAVGLL
jgi:hypothetical protein